MTHIETCNDCKYYNNGYCTHEYASFCGCLGLLWTPKWFK